MTIKMVNSGLKGLIKDLMHHVVYLESIHLIVNGINYQSEKGCSVLIRCISQLNHVINSDKEAKFWVV